jgi:hypothetical protein
MKETNKTNTETKTPSRHGKQNGYSNATLHAKRDAKRKEAESRQFEYDSLTVNEKVEKAKSQRGNNSKVLKKLSLLVKDPPAKTPKAEVKNPAKAPKA